MQGFSAGITRGCRACGNTREDPPLMGRALGTLAKIIKGFIMFPVYGFIHTLDKLMRAINHRTNLTVILLLFFAHFYVVEREQGPDVARFHSEGQLSP